jgi:hypothetical protein
MNTDKLVKAIQIIVKEEIKEVLPKLVKEGVKMEMAKLLKENKQLREALKPQKPQQPTFMDSEPLIENTTQQQTVLSKNPILNEVLAQTQPFNSQQRSGAEVPSYAGAPTETSFGTMQFDSTSTHTLGQQNIAQKMGYGDMAMPGQRQGLGVQTGNQTLDKAFNRDYSQLMKALDKKKGPWRPGMD